MSYNSMDDGHLGNAPDWVEVGLNGSPASGEVACEVKFCLMDHCVKGQILEEDVVPMMVPAGA